MVETVRDEKLEVRQVRRPGLVSIVQEVDAGVGGRDGGFSRAPRASGVGWCVGGESGERRGTPTRGASSSRSAISNDVDQSPRRSRRGLEASRTSANPPARVVHRARPRSRAPRATRRVSFALYESATAPSRRGSHYFSVVGCPKSRVEIPRAEVSVVAVPRARWRGGRRPASRADREGALRANVSRLSDDADDPQVVASALSAIRKELRGSPEGPEWVVKVRDTALRPTAAAADAISRMTSLADPPRAPSLESPGPRS